MERYALVTGASKGIGKALAIELAKRRENLVLVARSEDLLQALKEDLEEGYGIKVVPHTADLTAPGEPQRLFERCQAEGLSVHMLLNNAGYGNNGIFHESDLDIHLNMNELNVNVLVSLTHLFLPSMIALEKAYVLNVASVAAHLPIPHMAIYAASKAYVESFSRAIREELVDTGVQVCCLSPGGVRTEFVKRSGNDKVSVKTDRWHINADECAQFAIQKMLENKAEIVPGWYNRLVVWLTRLLPTAWLARSTKRIYDQREPQ